VNKRERYIKCAALAPNTRFDNASKMIRPLPLLAPRLLQFPFPPVWHLALVRAFPALWGLRFRNDGADGNGERQKVHDQPLGQVGGAKQQTEHTVRFLGISGLEASCCHLRRCL
jgi:hypothetical protein